VAKVSALTQSTNWDVVNFPVELIKFNDLLPGYQSMAPDRQRFIVGHPQQGEPQIFGLQGPAYGLIPNSVIEEVAKRVLGRHDVTILQNGIGDYSFNISLPQEKFTVINPARTGHVPDENRPDTLQKSLILTNSYTGKSHFTIQGHTIADHYSKTNQIIAPRMRVSYYREICTNGLMGWADEHKSMDEYLEWLIKGKKSNYNKVKEIKTTLEPEHVEETLFHDREVEQIIELRKIVHKGIDINQFKLSLTRIMKEFLHKEDSLTRQIYVNLAQHTIQRKRAEKAEY
jgi:hypothetical protein